MKKICLISDHHICLNPRLWKEAKFYEKIGFKVVVVTAWKSENFLEKDNKILEGSSIVYKPYLNLVAGNISNIKQKYIRIRKRIAAELVRLGLESGWSISHAPRLLYKAALAENADLYSAHMEFGFFCGRKLALAGKKVIFDFEDWYSRDYLNATRPVKLLAKLEQFALEHGLFCTVTSLAMADALKRTYNTRSDIGVIYNGFPLAENNVVSDYSGTDKAKLPKIIWFSRNIGPERGIETLFEALALLNRPVQLHLLGMSNPVYISRLHNSFPIHCGHELKVHDFIAHEQLIPFLTQFDIGLAIEVSESESRKVTITNKIMQYLEAGLNIIATDTAGQKEVAAFFPGTIQLVKTKETEHWALSISQLLEKYKTPKETRARFNEIFSWEAQEEKLSALLKHHLPV